MPIILIFIVTLTVIGVISGLIPLLTKPLPGGKVTDPRELVDTCSQFIDLNGITIHYKKFGTGKPVLILLHGIGSNLFSWEKIIPVLSEQFTIIAYDWVGFGLTTRPKPGTWTTDNPYGTSGQVNTLIGLMDALAVEKAVLVGHSFGGSIAGETALLHPDRVTGLILVDPALKIKRRSILMKLLTRTPKLDWFGHYLSRQIVLQGDNALRKAWHDPSVITPEILEGYYKPLKMAGWDYGLWEFFKAEKINVLAKAGQIKLPVLIITGSDDRIVPTRSSIELYRWIPGAEMAVIDDAGHNPQEERPSEFISIIQAFIRKITK